MKEIKWAKNEMPKDPAADLDIMSIENVKSARAFHKSFPQYGVTPLVKLQKMSEFLGLKQIYLKDESYRFGLNAFKVLGGSFAIARYIADATNKKVSELSYDYLTSDKFKNEFPGATFFTATDGNHGRGVAWAANKLGQKSVVFMPKGSTKTRFDNIQRENATVTIEEVNYDECVRLASCAAAKEKNGVVIQDTAWEGYEKIPCWIMQGYGTMAMEAEEQLGEYGCEKPTHIFIQAGVGSLAGAVQGYFANKFRDNPPKVVVVEAEAAACLYKSAAAKDGAIRIVDGDMETIMAGLACGEPNTISWKILKNHADTFLSCPDWVAVLGMRRLAAPIKGDNAVTSGESGAAPFGALFAIMRMPEYSQLRQELGLDCNSRVLLFSTEGDTDPDRYERIVWQGLDI